MDDKSLISLYATLWGKAGEVQVGSLLCTESHETATAILFLMYVSVQIIDCVDSSQMSFDEAKRELDVG